MNVSIYHGGKRFHIWMKVFGHFQLGYLSCALACLEHSRRRKMDVSCTMEQLHREAIYWNLSLFGKPLLMKRLLIFFSYLEA
jgi:hypothetical protein